MNLFAKRKYIIGGIFVFVVLIFVVKLFRLQVLNPEYKQYATENILRKVISYPSRGLIYDRNGELLVYNQAAYDLLVTPREVKAFDTLDICKILDVTPEYFIGQLDKAKEYSKYKPSVLVSQISSDQYAVLQEKLHKFPGFYVQIRTLREYPKKIAAHILGDVGEVNPGIVERDKYYNAGDYIGLNGVEMAYEEKLRGQKGVNYYLVDVHNRIKDSYRSGELDTFAVRGGIFFLRLIQNCRSTVNC